MLAAAAAPARRGRGRPPKSAAAEADGPSETIIEVPPMIGSTARSEVDQVPFLGEIPLDTTIREGGDRGIPVVIANPDNPASKAFLAVGRSLRERLG